jgi:DNA-directed RNA polymerase alpha subunit
MNAENSWVKNGEFDTDLSKMQSGLLDYQFPIENLPLSTRSKNNLMRSCGGDRVGDLRWCSKQDLSKGRNLGPKSLSEIMEVLDRLGLKLKGDR